MNPKTSAFVKILQYIGAPLIRDIIQTDHTAETGLGKTAETMAGLLSKTLKLSDNLSGAAEQTAPDNTPDDALRVALSAVASHVIGGYYKQTKTIPDDGAITQITDGLKAALGFSDNFRLSESMAERLEKLDTTTIPHDQIQFNLQHINALSAVVHAVSTHDFGQNRETLITEIAQRLEGRALSVRRNTLPDITDDVLIKQAEFSIFKALSEIYVACHQAAGKDGTAEQVWTKFDDHVSVLEAYIKSVSNPAANTPVTKTAQPTTTPPPVSKPEPTPKQKQETSAPKPEPVSNPDTAPQKPAIFGGTPKGDTTEKSSTPEQAQTEKKPDPPAPSSEETPSPPPADGAANPMGFFTAKKEGTNDAPETPSSAPEAPTTKSETENTDDATEGKTSSDSSTQGDSSNPMSFFGKKSD